MTPSEGAPSRPGRTRQGGERPEPTGPGSDRLTYRMPESDALVVARAREGDSQAFRALVERHSRTIFRLAHRMTGNEHDAEDVVQETFLRAYRQIGRFEARANFGTWLYRIAVNCSVDLIRSRRREAAAEGVDDLEQLGTPPAGQAESPDLDRLVFSAEIRQRVTAALEGLSHMERAAFVLRHFEGQSIDDIGRTLGLRTNATKHSIFRAVRKMRVALEPLIDAEAGR
jgi:RNA polymerase sigma-70 factor (ECF subfamily)